ncbi:MAG TPA: winged helix-turn-helix domain-containing protein [Blastocatellia bacterium]|nr:winged helix-turn-helix domain-containing protein [Blastocatellia bacterium]
MDSVTKAGASYRFDDVVVDCDRLRIEKDGQPRKLTPRAFDVLVYLVEHRGRVTEKQELFDNVWKEQFVTDNALTRIIKEIRQVIGDDADAPRYIETVPKRGYRFIANLSAQALAEQETRSAEAPDAEHVQIASAELQKPAETKGQPHKASEVGAVRGLSKSAMLAGAIAAFAVALIALIIWRTQPKQATPEAAASLMTTQITTWPGLDNFPTLSPDGNSIAYSSDHNSSFEIYSKQLTAGAREIQLTSDGQQNFQPAWSPDGKLIAYYSKKRGGIWIVPASGGTAKQLTEFGSRPRWSVDGATVVFQSFASTDLGANTRDAMPPSTIWVVPSQGGDPTPVTQVGTPPGGHGSPSWSPDGKRIVFTASDFLSGGLWSVSPTGEELRQLDKSLCFDPVWSPDGETIYYARAFALWKIRVSPTSGETAGEPGLVVSTAPLQIRHLTISADGKRIAYSQLSNDSNLWSVPVSKSTNLATGLPAPLTRNTNSRNLFPLFSPDGGKIAFYFRHSGVQTTISTIDADGRNQVNLTAGTTASISSGWFPEGDQVAFLTNKEGRSTLWSVSLKSGRERLLLEIDQGASYARLSPDGKEIAISSKGAGATNVWTIQLDGGQAKQITFDDELMGFPCWSPDGKLLAFQIERGDDHHIAIVPKDGGTPEQLTFDRGLSWAHSWSGDGDKIAFAGFRNGYWNIWWVSRSTKTQKMVTSYAKLNAYVRYPAWSPLGDQIVYEYAEVTGNIWLMELK